MLKDDVFAIDVAEISEALHKAAKRYLFLFGVTSVPQHSDPGTFPPLLGERRKRRR